MTEKTHENLALHSADGHLHLPRRAKVWRNARNAALIRSGGAGARRRRGWPVGRGAAKAELETQSLESQRVFVKTVSPAPSKSANVLTLPATLRGDNETAIYARVTGYVRTFAVDIGGRVAKGQVLAELDTPELDQQVRAGAGAARTGQGQCRARQGGARTLEKAVQAGFRRAAGPRHQAERL